MKQAKILDNQTVAKIGKKLVPYDACSRRPAKIAHKGHKKLFKYIGIGYIYSVNGVVLPFTCPKKMRFWKYKKKHEYLRDFNIEWTKTTRYGAMLREPYQIPIRFY